MVVQIKKELLYCLVLQLLEWVTRKDVEFRVACL